MATDGDSMDDDVFETLENVDGKLNVSDRNFSQKGGTPSPTGYRNYKPPDEVLKLAENDVIESTELAIHKIVHEEEDHDEKEISGDEGALADNDKNSAVQENWESIENVPKRKATPSTEKKSEEATPSRKRQKRNEDSKKLDKAFKILSEASANARNPQEQNECQIFGNLVAKKLAKYSLELQSTVQQDIMLILFKADKTHLEQSSTNFYHSQSYRTHTLQSFFANSVPQHSQFEQYQESQASSFTEQHSQVPCPAYNYANSSISDHSSRSTPVNSLPRQLLDMPDIELENLR